MQMMTLEGIRQTVEEAFTRPWKDVLPYLQEVFPEVEVRYEPTARPPMVTIEHPEYGQLEVRKWLKGEARFSSKTRERLDKELAA